MREFPESTPIILDENLFCTDVSTPLHCKALIRAGKAIHNWPYLANNHLTPLINGDQAYPEMIEAISQAKSHIFLSSYIFDYDRAGKRFIEAIDEAKKRGVKIDVMIDGFGIGHLRHKID